MASEAAYVQSDAKRPWTVMVYMAAGDSAEMDDYAVRDLREMERGANEHVHVAVQIKRHWPAIPQRYVITRHGRSAQAHQQSPAKPNHTNMGDEQTLADFLEWAVKECPADHYMLVLWGHSYGLGFGRDHGDPLRLTELVKALTAFREARVGAEEEQLGDREGVLDVLGANACAMSYAEAAYELRDSANYLLASQISVPFAGWSYAEVLQSITAETTPKQLGANVIDSYVTGLNNPLTGERVQMSLLNLSHAGVLRDTIDNLAAAIRAAFRSNGHFDSGRRAAIRDAFIAAAAGDVRPLIDLQDLSRALKRDLCDPQLRTFVALSRDIPQAKRDWLEQTAQYLEQQLDQLKDVVKEPLLAAKGNHPSLAELCGVGIYVPFVTDEQDLKRLGLEDDSFSPRRSRDRKGETNRGTYERLALFSDAAGSPRGTWPALVYDDLSEPMPTELADLIADIGVTNSTDRAEIAQIVLSIESTFNKLDRVLDTAQAVVTGKLRQEHSPTDRTYSKVARQHPRLLGLSAPTPEDKARPRDKVTDPIVLEWIIKLESVLEEVERTTKKGLTQARFGLGPVVSPRGFDNTPVKTDEGAPPRDARPGFSGGPVKTGEGFPGESRTTANPLVFEGDAELRPAFRLFSRAADALRRLEQATSELERQAAQSRVGDTFEEEVLGLRQTFGILCETATSARRTIRKVIANPAYGLGPSAAAFDRDDREELANAAGMGSRDLLLISFNPLQTGSGAEGLDHSKKSLHERIQDSARAHAGMDTSVPVGD